MGRTSTLFATAVLAGATMAATSGAAYATEPCNFGYACFYSGSVQVAAVTGEAWYTLPTGGPLINGFANNQALGDDACVSTSSSGSYDTFCLAGGQGGPVPVGMVVRAVRA